MSVKITFLIAFLSYLTNANAHSIVTMCGEDETVVFSCDAKEKRLAICIVDDAASKQPVLKYRIGDNSFKLEFQYPKNGQGKFFTSDKRSARGREDRLRFVNGEFTYIVYSISDADTDNYAGVNVFRNKKKVGNVSCDLKEEPWHIYLPRSFAQKEPYDWNLGPP